MENDKKLEQDKKAFFYTYATAKYKRDIFSKDGSVDTVGPYPVKERLSDIDLMDYFNPSYGRVKQVNDYLELTDLRNITDEHAIEVANKCLGLLSGHSYIKHKAFKNNILRIIITNPSYQPEEKEICVEIRFLRLELTDYLRSQSYLLPFRNYTTDQLLSIGWAKLKQQ